MSFRYAFVVLDAARIAGVFTEHCGYYCFGRSGLVITSAEPGGREERSVGA